MSNIPKIVHYIWFGKGEKNDLIKKCIQKTRDILPDWEIMEWDEGNYDITSCVYMKEAYDKKKYAFASDYARFDILYKYGGVYLDTDVELLKRFPEEMFCDSGFSGVESNNMINPGLAFASEPGNVIVKEILEDYHKDHFINEQGKINTRTVVDRVTELFVGYGFIRNGRKQIIQGFHIYPYDYFCAFDFTTRDFCVTENTVSKHHYAATWTGKGHKFKNKLQNILYKCLGENVYKRVIEFKRKLFGIHGE